MHKLKQILDQEDTVVFIGSGISLWSGLPSWSGLIEELARFVVSTGANADLVRQEALGGDLLQAASYGFDKLTKPQLREFIQAACRYGHAKPHEIHRKIVSLRARCFVTTNYDNLLEEALRQWQPNRFFPPPITNRHLTEMGKIVHARATDFIFKPHGDAADIDSIILTREQYRQLLPQGERHSALESLKMLLASRPVVYLGFGLRDPDFLYIRDLLANIYKGGVRDHYAIMADVAEAECNYWRSHYGIHLVSYPTCIGTDGKKDHTGLLTLLDLLLEPGSAALTQNLNEVTPKVSTADLVLALARHAARLARAAKVSPEVVIRVYSDAGIQRRKSGFHEPNKFDHYPVGKFLDACPERALLIGLPGAGKSYALGQAARRLAEKLHEVCLTELFDESAVVVPLIVDLKLYRGNLAELISQTLPLNVSLNEIFKRFRAIVFLDSFNEMPKEYSETGSYESDFVQFVNSLGRSSLIIGSRTNDGLDKFAFPSYCLDMIDAELVSAELHRRGVEIGGRFDHEIRSLLQKPFYFQLVISGAVAVPKEAHPRDLYASLFLNLEHAFVSRFGKSFGLRQALSLAAYEAINRGEEAYPLSELLRTIRANITMETSPGIQATDIANWLVSASILIPHIGGRIAFVHQSVTEFLAAEELARRYATTPHLLKEKLALRRWDQALFLTLSFLPPEPAETFLNDVVHADLTLALEAVKYLERERDTFVAKLLHLIPGRVKGFRPFEAKIEWILEASLPLSEIHEPQLRSLMKLGGCIGGAAVKRLSAMKGRSFRDELWRHLVEARSDYNYIMNGVAGALRAFAVPEDAQRMAEVADGIPVSEVSDESEDDIVAFTSGAAEVLADIDLAVIKAGFLPNDQRGPVPELRARILCLLAEEHHSTAALDLAADLLLRGVNEAATTIYFVAHFANQEHTLEWGFFTRAHIVRLIDLMDAPGDDCWALRALQCICLGRPDLAPVVEAEGGARVGIARAALLCCAGGDVAPIFIALRELLKMSSEQRMQEPTHLLADMDIIWAGNEELFVQLLKLREYRLALVIIEHVYGATDYPLDFLEIGPITWWLDWLAEETGTGHQFLVRDRLPWLFSRYLSKETRHAFAMEFNNVGSKYREVLSQTILLHQNDLTTDDFSADSVSFLLSDLAREAIPDPWRGHLLGRTATEQFVAERLLPLIPEAKGLLLNNLQAVLRQAGSRHGRRYLFE